MGVPTMGGSGDVAVRNESLSVNVEHGEQTVPTWSEISRMTEDNLKITLAASWMGQQRALPNGACCDAYLEEDYWDWFVMDSYIKRDLASRLLPQDSCLYRLTCTSTEQLARISRLVGYTIDPKQKHMFRGRSFGWNDTLRMPNDLQTIASQGVRQIVPKYELMYFSELWATVNGQGGSAISEMLLQKAAGERLCRRLRIAGFLIGMGFVTAALVLLYAGVVYN